MNARWILLVALGLTLLAAAADLAWHLPRMPERMATHFDAGGVADGWSERSGFVLTQAVILLLVPAMFVGLALLAPRLPTGLINLPHRDYWLAPARRAATAAAISHFLLFMGVLITLFLAGLMHLMLRANLQPSPRVGAGVGVLVGIQVTALLAAIVWLLWRFRKPRVG